MYNHIATCTRRRQRNLSQPTTNNGTLLVRKHLGHTRRDALQFGQKFLDPSLLGLLALWTIHIRPIRRHLAIHQKRSMRVISNIRLRSIDQCSTTLLRRSCNKFDHDPLEDCSEPAHVVAENIGIARSGCEVVDYDLALPRAERAPSSKFADRVEQKQFRDIVSICDICAFFLAQSFEQGAGSFALFVLGDVLEIRAVEREPCCDAQVGRGFFELGENEQAEQDGGYYVDGDVGLIVFSYREFAR